MLVAQQQPVAMDVGGSPSRPMKLTTTPPSSGSRRPPAPPSDDEDEEEGVEPKQSSVVLVRRPQSSVVPPPPAATMPKKIKDAQAVAIVQQMHQTFGDKVGIIEKPDQVKFLADPFYMAVLCALCDPTLMTPVASEATGHKAYVKSERKHGDDIFECSSFLHAITAVKNMMKNSVSSKKVISPETLEYMAKGKIHSAISMLQLAGHGDLISDLLFALSIVPSIIADSDHDEGEEGEEEDEEEEGEEEGEEDDEI